MAKLTIEIPDDYAGEALTNFCKQHNWNADEDRVTFFKRKILDFALSGRDSLEVQKQILAEEYQAKLAALEKPAESTIDINV